MSSNLTSDLNNLIGPSQTGHHDGLLTSYHGCLEPPQENSRSTLIHTHIQPVLWQPLSPRDLIVRFRVAGTVETLMSHTPRWIAWPMVARGYEF